MELGTAGLDADLRSALPRPVTQTHEVGNAVRTMDVDSGPLTNIEYKSFTTAMRRKFGTGHIVLTLAMTLGIRSLQFAAMKYKDFCATQRQDGSSIFILQVTRLKQDKGNRTLSRQPPYAGST